MSTIVARLDTVQSYEAKRKADTDPSTQGDVLHVKRARKSYDGDVYSTHGYKTFTPTLILPSLTVTQSDASPQDSPLSLYPPRGSTQLGTIAAVASSEFSLYPKTPEINRGVPSRTPFSGYNQIQQESVAASPLSSEDDLSYDDLHLDLDLDPESEDLNEVNASALLFFIGKPREEKKDSENVLQDALLRENKDVKKDKKKHKRKRGHFPKATTDLLKQWLFEHQDHPYPTEEQKSVLADDTGLTVKQINYWFTNSRRRFLKPKNE